MKFSLLFHRWQTLISGALAIAVAAIAAVITFGQLTEMRRQNIIAERSELNIMIKDIEEEEIAYRQFSIWGRQAEKDITNTSNIDIKTLENILIGIVGKSSDAIMYASRRIAVTHNFSQGSIEERLDERRGSLVRYAKDVATNAELFLHSLRQGHVEVYKDTQSSLGHSLDRFSYSADRCVDTLAVLKSEVRETLSKLRAADVD